MKMIKRNTSIITIFTLVEILIVISIIALLAGLLFPVLKKARQRSKKTSCMSNLKQLGIALNAYATANDGRLPTAKRVGEGPDDSGQISNILIMENEEVYHCPSDTVAQYDGKTHFVRYGSSYEWQVWANNRLIDKAKFKLSTVEINTPLMNDAENFHGSLGKNFLYEDGSVSDLREDTVE